MCGWQVLDVLCGVAEYDELPVRHNEDKLNMTLSGTVRFPIKERDADDPHAKAKLLLQVQPTPGIHPVKPVYGRLILTLVFVWILHP